MSSEDEFKRLYTGSEVNVKYLQGLLEEKKIVTRVRNEFESGLRGGFGGGLPGHVQLFVGSEGYPEAKKIVEQTFPNEPGKQHE